MAKQNIYDTHATRALRFAAYDDSGPEREVG